MVKKNRLLDAALAYAARGWAVFPVHGIHAGKCSCGGCDKAGKAPYVPWRRESTCDPVKIRGWWARWPTANVGCETGAKSGLSVLDVDVPEGEASLEALPPLPDTLSSRTGSGGRHLLYQYTESVRTAVAVYGAGLDVRNDGGYIILPPSRHVSGGAYAWLNEGAELGEWPASLAAQRRGRGRPRSGAEFNAEDERERELLRSALAECDPDSRDNWYQFGLALGRAFDADERGWAVYEEWAARSEKFNDKGTREAMREMYYREWRAPRGDAAVLRIATIFHRAREAGWTPPGERPKSTIFVREGGDLDLAVAAADEALAASAGVYARGGALVKVVDGARLLLHTPVTIREELTRLIDWRERNRRGSITGPRDAPPDISAALVARGRWDAIREIKGLCATPVFREDGTLVTEAGHDAASGMYLTEGGWDAIPERVTEADARRALRELLEPFTEFRFADENSLAVLTAAILTVGTRNLYGTAPFFIFSAPIAGSGKSLLTDVLHALWFGAAAPKIAYPREEEELRKLLTATLLTGTGMVVFDNVERGRVMDNALLAKVLTDGVWEDRILGQSSTIRIPLNTTFFATGNNLAIGGDLVRRSLGLWIDPACERPERREFAITNLVEHVKRARRELVRAALTLVRGWWCAGRPLPRGEAGSFEGWSTIVRGVCCWAGVGDPLASNDTLREADDEGQNLNELLVGLWERFGDEGGALFTSADIVTRAVGGDRELLGLIEGCLNGAKRGEAPNVRAISWMLKTELLGRIFGSYRLLLNRRDGKGTAVWKIISSKGPGGF